VITWPLPTTVPDAGLADFAIAMTGAALIGNDTSGLEALRPPSPVMVDVLSIDPPSTAGLLTVTLKLSVTVPPAATVPTVKVTCGGGPAVNAHDGVHDAGTNVVPGGIASVTTTFVAGTTFVGFDTVSVYVIVLPGVMNPFASGAGVTDAALEMVAAGLATSVCE